MHEKYEWFSLYILMIKNWDSMRKSRSKYEQIRLSEIDIQWINLKTSAKNCKLIIWYFAQIFLLQHTDRTWTKINWL